LAAVEPPLAPSTIRFLYSNNATTTRDSIFVTAQIPAPDILRRNIVGAGSMVGVVQTAGEQSTFFILAVSSYNQTFGGLLAWEKTSMLRDLEQFYPSYPAPVVPVAIVATTTATSTVAKPATTTPAATSTPPAPAYRAGFYDEVVANHDVRVYKDAKNRTVLLYGYPDQKKLVIARSAAAFTEIVDRLRNSRTQ
jgi:hypothetical protein